MVKYSFGLGEERKRVNLPLELMG